MAWWNPASWFAKRETPAGSGGSSVTYAFSAYASSGLYVDENTALSIGAVYACVRLLASTVAAQPWHVFQRLQNGERDKASFLPLYRVVHMRPNDYQSPFGFFETMMMSLLFRGNAYMEIEWAKSETGFRDVKALHPIHPDRVRGEIEDGLPVYYIDGVRKTRADIFHIVGLSTDGYFGKSPLTIAADMFGLTKIAEQYGGRVFKNNATPSGLLTTEQKLTTPQAQAIADRFKQNNGGQNAGSIAVLDAGAKFEKISISPEDAQFLGTRQFQVEEIARFFGVPPHKIAKIDKAAYASIEHQAIEFVQDSIRPWTARIEHAFDTQLIRKEQDGLFYVEANLDGLLRGDFAARTNGYASALNNGWLNINEVRKLENLPGIGPDGDTYRYPLNMGIVGKEAMNE